MVNLKSDWTDLCGSLYLAQFFLGATAEHDSAAQLAWTTLKEHERFRLACRGKDMEGGREGEREREGGKRSWGSSMAAMAKYKTCVRWY